MWTETRNIIREIEDIYGLDKNFKIKFNYTNNHIKAKIKSDIFNKDLLFKSNSEHNLKKEIEQVLVKEIVTLSKDYLPSDILISFCQNYKIDVLAVHNNSKNKKIQNNEICEQFRKKVFKNEYGCYSCFDLIDSYKKIAKSKEIKKIFNPKLYDNTVVFSDGSNVVAWDWSNGDGTLYLKIKNTEYINYDCKKSYGWKNIRG